MVKSVRKTGFVLTSRKVIDALLAAAGIMFCIVVQAVSEPGFFLSIIVLGQFGYCLVTVRENRLLLLMYGVMAYAAYSICYANYLNPITTTMFTSLSGTYEAVIAMQILVLFSSMLVLCLPQNIEPYGEGDYAFSGEEHNPAIVYVVLIVLAVILVYAFGRPDTIGGDRGSPSPLYEYSTIFFVLGFYLAGSKRGLRFLMLGMLILFAGQNIIYGGRVTAVQLLIIAFFCFVNGKTSNRMLFVVGGVLLVFFIGFGGVRTSIWNSGLTAVLQSFLETAGKGFAWDTAFSSWHTSVTFVEYDKLIDFDRHAYLLRQWLASIILGGSVVPDSGLAALTRVYFPHYYGGVLPVFVWFYLGPIGTVASAIYISFFAKCLSGLGSAPAPGRVFGSAWRLCLVYIVATVPRWFLYSPSQITRGLILCFVVCFVALWVDEGMRKQKGEEGSDCETSVIGV